MAKNIGNGKCRKGAITKRSQIYNPLIKKWVKRDTKSGKFIDQKADNKPFKSIRKEK